MYRGARLVAGSLLLLAIASGCDDDPCTTCTDDAIRGVARYFDGEPMIGVQVEVTGKPPVSTGTDGSFVVSGVTPPYDITLHAAIVQVWRGLTRRDPELYSITGPPQGIAGAHISGQVHMSWDQFALVFFVAPNARRITRASPFLGYDLGPEWLEGSPDPVGNLYVLMGPIPNAEPWIATEYTGWGSKPVALSHGSAAVVDFTPADLVEPETSSISGHLTLPTGFELDDFQLSLNIDGQSIEILNAPQAVNASGDFTLHVPVLPSTSFRIAANAYAFGNGSQGFSQAVADSVYPNANIVLDLKSPPALQTPVAGATDVGRTTTFSWTPGSGQGVYLYYLRSADFRTRLYVIQSGESLRWEDLTTAALVPQGSADYTWSVRQLQFVPNVDTAAAPGIIASFYARGDDAGSEVRDLRTAP